MDTSNSKIYINEYGTKIYYNPKCQVHREDGPAREYVNGDKFWYKEGKRHRVDGPAKEYVNGCKAWYIFYKYLEEEEFNSWILRIKIFI